MDTSTVFRKIIRSLRLEEALLLRNNCLDFSEKVRALVSSFPIHVMNETIRDLLLKRLVEAEDGTRFFSICGYKIYFQPNYRIRDERCLLEGVTQVLTETFLFPEFFTPEVCVKKGDTVLDLGAYLGTATLLFSRSVGENGEIYAFEPVTHNIVWINMEKNNIGNVEVVPKAITHEVGRVEIEMSSYCLDSTIAKRKNTKNHYTDKKMVDTTSLDAFVDSKGLERLDFIKMDIEGAEELAIRGAKKVIERFRPKWSISSYHSDFNNEPQHERLVKLLKKYAYKIDEIKGYRIYAW
jgi:FkbM family methyltransferase